jgi:hypothetical protein
MSSTVKLLIAVLACPAVASDCSATNSCSQPVDDTSLVQVKLNVKRGNDRQDPLLEAELDPLYSTDPLLGDGLGAFDGLYGNNAGNIAGANEYALAHQDQNDLQDAGVGVAVDDSDAQEYAGAQEYVNGADENTYANAKLIEGTDDAAEAKAFVAGTDLAAKERAFAADNAEAVSARDAVSDRKIASVENAFDLAAKRRDRNEAKAAETFELAEESRVADAEAAANAAYEQGAEQEAYADQVRTAQSEAVRNRVEAADAVRNEAKYVHAERVKIATDEAAAKRMQEAEMKKEADEATAYKTMEMSEAKRKARVNNAVEADYVKTSIAEAGAARAARVREADNFAKMRVAERGEAEKAVAAVAAYEAQRNAKVQTAVNAAAAKEVSDTQGLAAANAKFRNNEAAFWNTAAMNYAKGWGEIVDVTNAEKRQEVTGGAKLLTAYNDDAIKFAKAYAGDVKKAWAAEKGVDALYQKHVAKDFAGMAGLVKTEQAALDEAGKAALKHELDGYNAYAKVYEDQGAKEVKFAQGIAAHDDDIASGVEKLSSAQVKMHDADLAAFGKVWDSRSDKFAKDYIIDPRAPGMEGRWNNWENAAELADKVQTGDDIYFANPLVTGLKLGKSKMKGLTEIEGLHVGPKNVDTFAANFAKADPYLTDRGFGRLNKPTPVLDLDLADFGKWSRFGHLKKGTGPPPESVADLNSELGPDSILGDAASFDYGLGGGVGAAEAVAGPLAETTESSLGLLNEENMNENPYEAALA